MNNKSMRKRKKTLLLRITAAVFIMLLLLRFDFGQLLGTLMEGISHGNPDNVKIILDKGPGHGSSFLRQMVAGHVKAPVHMVQCSNPYLKSAMRPDVEVKPDCVRRPPSQAACQLTRELFGQPEDIDPDTVCPAGVTYCTIQGIGGARKVTCKSNRCKRRLYLGSVNIDTGQYTWSAFHTIGDLEKAILLLINQPNGGYCLVRCGPDKNLRYSDERVTQADYSESQILNLPPFVKNITEWKMRGALNDTSWGRSAKKNHINFNFVFIDSVSRHHLFRSLPRSIKLLEAYAADSTRSKKPVILDFELVQAVRSRTFETLQALFSGLINPFEKPFATQAMPKTSLKTEMLLKPLKACGFRTLWMEDLCPSWEWGISKDFLVFKKNLTALEKWVKLKAALKDAGIDSIGNTASSCRILHANNVPDPFHGPDTLCFNGKHQHQYQLDFLKLFQESLEHSDEPFFTFYQTNIGHEDSGRRIQYLDKALSEYLEYAAGLEDTLTVIFSDHGNAYGSYLGQSNEAKIELFHPFLMMIVPIMVRKWIGETKISALIRNQKRLVSVLDLHYTFLSLIDMVQKRQVKQSEQNNSYPNLVSISKVSDFNSQFNVTQFGLLEDVSPSRTCSYLPRIMPNYCICENYELETQAVHFHVILAQFLIGEINNEIQSQRAKGIDLEVVKTSGKALGGFGSCYRLTIDHINNVRQSVNTNGVYSIKMDMFVKGAPNLQPEIFFASATLHSRSTNAIQLESFDRITPYSKFSVCSDLGVELKLCVCNVTNDVVDAGKMLHKVTEKDKHRDLSEIKNSLLESLILKGSLRTNISEVAVRGSRCLLLVSHTNGAGSSVTAVNACVWTMQISVRFVTSNLILSSSNPLERLLSPRDVTFLSSGVLADPDKGWSMGMSVGYRLL